MVQTIQDLTILLIVSLPINLLFHKIKLPSIAGFLVAGVVIGPHAMGLIPHPQSVEHLAEIGVILLLFIIGLEFSLGRFLKHLVRLLGAGSLQLALTTLAVFLIMDASGFPQPQSLAVGLILALSSTAVVLKMITDRAELDTVHGRTCVGILLFQDLCVVPLMLIFPLLAQSGDVSVLDVGGALLKSIVAVVGIFLLSRLFVPRALETIARTGSREHLTLFVILLILGTAWVSWKLGLSLAMGAFIAGMILSESDYSHQIILDILPVKDYFGGIFFISVGMLLQIGIFIDSVAWYLMLAMGVILLKAVLALAASRIVGNPWRMSFLVGLRLAQVGEFSLILAQLALDSHLFTSPLYQSILLVSVLSLLVAPLLIQGSIRISLFLFSGRSVAAEEEASSPTESPLNHHVIVAGYGLVGRNLSKVLKETLIPFIVIELDGELIKQALTEKVEVLYGEPMHRQTLIRAGVTRAKVMVVSISDTLSAEQTVRLARQLNPHIYLLAQTRLASQVEALREAGADQVIPEEFETSIEMFSRVLREFRIPDNIIEQQVELVRLEGYSMFRGLSLNVEVLQKFSTYLAASLSQSFQVMEHSWSAGKQVQDIQLTEQTGATLLAAVRNNKAQPNPEADFLIEPGDLLILYGRHAQADHAMRYLASGPEENTDSPSS